jgi:hypothetical protein
MLVIEMVVESAGRATMEKNSDMAMKRTQVEG